MHPDIIFKIFGSLFLLFLYLQFNKPYQSFQFFLATGTILRFPDFSPSRPFWSFIHYHQLALSLCYLSAQSNLVESLLLKQKLHSLAFQPQPNRREIDLPNKSTKVHRNRFSLLLLWTLFFHSAMACVWDWVFPGQILPNPTGSDQVLPVPWKKSDLVRPARSEYFLVQTSIMFYTCSAPFEYNIFAFRFVFCRVYILYLPNKAKIVL